jgi:DNA-binding transcriptional ArsR family regulator
MLERGGGTMAFAETFKALSDPARRQILELLKGGPLSAGEIASHFSMTGATISYHLKILEQSDLIFGRREKNFIYYQLNTSVLEEIMLWISTLKGGDQDAENT